MRQSQAGGAEVQDSSAATFSTEAEEQILCVLAAQASASLRAAGQPDPLNSVKQVTPGVLAGMGVSEARQKTSLAQGYFYWIKQIYAAGEYDAVVETRQKCFRCAKEKAWIHVSSRMRT